MSERKTIRVGRASVEQAEPSNNLVQGTRVKVTPDNGEQFQWPVQDSSFLWTGNITGQVAVCPLYSNSEPWVEKLAGATEVAIVGNLYSAHGINGIIRNLLAKPGGITTLILCGQLLNQDSYRSLHDLFRFRFRSADGSPDGQVLLPKGQLQPEIPYAAVKQLVEKVTLIDLADVPLTEAIGQIRSYQPPKTEELQSSFCPRLFPEHVIETITLPSHEAVEVIRVNKIIEGWLEVLNRITLFGPQTAERYGKGMKETLTSVVVISDEDPHNFWIPDFAKEELDELGDVELSKYISSILSGERGSEEKYAYGHLLRSWGPEAIDQIKRTLDIICAERYDESTGFDTREAVGMLWDPRVDPQGSGGGSPCLVMIQVRVRDGKVHLVATLRSNNMYGSWPENAFSLRAIQQEWYVDEIKRRIGIELKLGELVIISNSAHIYLPNVEAAKKLVRKYLRPARKERGLVADPRGAYHIWIKNGLILVDQLDSSTGAPIRRYRGKRSERLARFIREREGISDVRHALYLGRQLQNAQIALELGISFRQDRPLDLTEVQSALQKTGR